MYKYKYIDMSIYPFEFQYYFPYLRSFMMFLLLDFLFLINVIPSFVGCLRYNILVIFASLSIHFEYFIFASFIAYTHTPPHVL